MSVFSNYIKQISLGQLLIALSVFSLGVALFLILVLSGIVRDRAVHDLAREDARQASKLVFQSLYSAMRKGWNKNEIKEIIQRLNTAMPGLTIRVYRGKIVEDQFGAMPGEAAVIAADPALKRALVEAKDEFLVKSEGNAIRYLYPVQAKQECLVCHTQSHVGAVHGVIDITYPIDSLKVSFGYVINSVVGYTLLVMGLVFSIMYFKLRVLLVMPISKLVSVMKRITSEMNFNHRVEEKNWITELRRLSEYFNRLLDTVGDYNKQLQELSVRDPLTNLYNRRKFEEFLDYEIVRSERHNHAFSVVMIDLDNFKFINDTYGHPVGDMVIKELSALLASNLRRGDVLARLGGDEFALILPETPAELGLQAANKLHQALRDEEFELPVGKIRVTASFSMVSYPEDGKSRDEIYAAMDVVLYKAKRQGKNMVMTAETEQDRTMMDIFRHGDFLRQALRNGQVDAFLQPIVDVRSRKVVAYEALARICDGDRIIPAGEFIEVAEELGMAKELDQRVFERSLSHLARLSRTQPEIRMFFNLSARSFNDVEWMRGIPAMAARYGVACDRIVLEITEREALPHMNQVKAIIDELRQQKIAFALDDFGSGFSSFLYLKFLVVDYVKIEGSFVRQIAVDGRDLIMVEHIHQMAHEFGLKTVAEFVEDEETAKMLAQIGVDYAQGYYYGRPAALPG